MELRPVGGAPPSGHALQVVDAARVFPTFLRDNEGVLDPALVAKNDRTYAGPRTIDPDTFAMEALAYLHSHAVDQVPVVDADGMLVGLLDVPGMQFSATASKAPSTSPAASRTIARCHQL